MKKTILVLIAAIGLSSCKKLDAPREVPSDTSKAIQKFNFYGEKDKYKIPTHEKGVVLFKLKDNSTLSRVVGRSSPERVFTKAMEKAHDNGFYKSRVGDEIKTLAELKKNPDVEWACLNYTEQTQGIPDDPYWTDGSLYGMLHIGMPAVWASGNFGNKNVVVGVIDEGIFGHEDLCNNIWKNPYELDNGIDDDGNGYIDDFNGWDWFNNDNMVYPGATHGTHVSGTIAGIGGNQKGVVGVNSNVTLISCKFLEQFGYDDNAVKAIDYLIDLKSRHNMNIKVTSNSWGGGGYNPGLLEAIKRARDADILFVAAAGNSGTNNDLEPNYPVGYDVDNIIGVGASDWQNNKASFSCFGATTVDIFAPGVGIVSTVPSSSHTSAYAFFSGTSMATPHVSGACALYAGIHPEASYAQIKAAILSNALPVAALNGLCVTGGLLNVSSFTGQTAERQPPFYDCPQLNPDNTPPTIPQNFRISEWGFDPRPGPFYGGYFHPMWDKSTDPEGSQINYILWFDGVPQWYLASDNYVIAGITDTTHPLIAWVQAEDSWGNQSGFSNRDTVIWNQGTPPPADTQPPTLNGSPTVTNATISSLTFNHTAASDNVGVVSYTVNWRAAGGIWLQRTSANLSETFSGLSEGTTYEFNYTAKDAAGNVSLPSQTITGTTLTTQPPPTCTINSVLDATSNSTVVTLSWTINAQTCSVASTRLERKKGGNGTFAAVAFDPTSPYQDNVGNPGQYTYRLRITLTNGQTGYSNEKVIQVKKK